MDRAEMVRKFDGAELAVRTRGLAKRYRKKRALAGLDLCVPEGSVYVLVGPNGAGKTTTLRLLLGLARPGRGTSRVFGLDSRRRRAEVRAAIGYVPESHRTPYGWMKVGGTARPPGGLPSDLGLLETRRLTKIYPGPVAALAPARVSRQSCGAESSKRILP